MCYGTTKKSPVAVQGKFKNEYRHQMYVESIREQYKTLTETGGVADHKRSGGPSVNDSSVTFQSRPRRLVRRSSTERKMSWSTVRKVLHKRPRLHAYKAQFVQDSSLNP